MTDSSTSDATDLAIIAPARSRQNPATVARICELGCAQVSVEEIDKHTCKALHREGYMTSTGTPWPPSNDGCV